MSERCVDRRQSTGTGLILDHPPALARSKSLTQHKVSMGRRTAPVGTPLLLDELLFCPSPRTNHAFGNTPPFRTCTLTRLTHGDCKSGSGACFLPRPCRPGRWHRCPSAAMAPCSARLASVFARYGGRHVALPESEALHENWAARKTCAFVRMLGEGPGCISLDSSVGFSAFVSMLLSLL